MHVGDQHLHVLHIGTNLWDKSDIGLTSHVQVEDTCLLQVDGGVGEGVNF